MLDKNQHTKEPETSSHVRATVESKTAKPAGLLPKNTQQLVILGVAVVMILIMWMTGGAKRAITSTVATPSGAPVQPPNAATVEDFKQTIQQQQAATRQPISSSNLERLQAVGLAGDVPPGSAIAPPSDSEVPQPGGIIGGPGQQQPPAPDPVVEDRKKRQYLSLFAPNVAFTHRPGADALHLTQPEEQVRNDKADRSSDEMEPSPLPTRSQLNSTTPVLAAPQDPGSEIEASETKSKSKQNSESSPPGVFNSFAGKKYVVFEGTILETLLINRLNGTFSGPINCLVTTDVYSHDRQRMLIPAGTKVLGEAKKVEAFGQQRLAVSFHRLVMPDGYSVNLDQFKGLNQIGETALRDKVNNHYLQIFGASLAIGILGGISEAGTGNALTSSPLDRVRSGFGSSIANSSTEILDRFLNVLPTVTIREGNRVKVYLSGDLLLPDYAQHTMQPDL